MKILQLLCSRRYCPENIPQMNCRANSIQDNSSSRITQKSQPLYCCRGVFIAPLHSNGRGADHTENTVLLFSRACMLRALLNNGRCLPIHCLATEITCLHLHCRRLFQASRTLITYYRTIRLHIPEYSALHGHSCDNLKSNKCIK
jgi:hypothetical protein